MFYVNEVLPSYDFVDPIRPHPVLSSLSRPLPSHSSISSISSLLRPSLPLASILSARALFYNLHRYRYSSHTCSFTCSTKSILAASTLYIMLTDALQVSDQPQIGHTYVGPCLINCAPLLADSSSYPSLTSVFILCLNVFLPVKFPSASFHAQIFPFVLLCISSTFPLVVLPLRSSPPINLFIETIAVLFVLLRIITSSIRYHILPHRLPRPVLTHFLLFYPSISYLFK